MATKAASSIESSPDLCAKAAISRITTEPAENQFTAKNLKMKISSSSIQVLAFSRWLTLAKTPMEVSSSCAPRKLTGLITSTSFLGMSLKVNSFFYEPNQKVSFRYGSRPNDGKGRIPKRLDKALDQD